MEPHGSLSQREHPSEFVPLNQITNELSTFTLLQYEMTDFPTYTRISFTASPQIKKHYHKVDGGEMFGTMVAMAERLIEKILEGATVDKTAFASGTSSTEKKTSSAKSLRHTRRGRCKFILSSHGHNELTLT